jgi:NADP-dependent aldehyde dehydrogenase
LATIELTGCSLIAGHTIEPEASAPGGIEPEASAPGGRMATSPATGESLPPAYHAATAEQVDEAARKASEAFATYSRLPGARHAAFLRRIAGNIEGLADQLVERVGSETALPEGRVRGETGRTVGQLRLFADIAEEGSWVEARIDPPLPDRQPLPRADIRSMLRPLGPVVVFGASNFPLAFSVAGGDTASALAAGCPVIVKAHSAHPGTSELVGRAVIAAAEAEDMPAGVFSVLFGEGSKVGAALVAHPLVKAVGFTGSLGAGRKLFDIAAARPEPIPVYAEMGSVNPVYLLPGALAERADDIATGLHQSATLGVGQFCTNPGVVMYDGNEVFRAKLVKLFDDTPAGHMLTAGIASSYADNLGRLREQPSVETLVAGPTDVSKCAAGATLTEVAADVLLADPDLADEVFGPATLLVRYDNPDQLAAVARMLPGQLTATVHGTTDELTSATDLLAVLETKAGRLVVNQFPTGVEVGHAMVHGGPYPATTDFHGTSVGATAILRFARRVCYQNLPDAALPDALKAGNPLGLRRLVDGKPE